MKKSDRNWLTLGILGVAGIGTVVVVAASNKRSTEIQTAAVENGNGAIPSDAVTYEGEVFEQYDRLTIARAAYASEFT